MSDASLDRAHSPGSLIHPGASCHHESPTATAAEIGLEVRPPCKTISASPSMLFELQSELAGFIEAARAVELSAYRHNHEVVYWVDLLYWSMKRVFDNYGDAGVERVSSIRTRLEKILSRWGWQGWMTSGGLPFGPDDPAVVLSPEELGDMSREIFGLEALLLTLSVNNLTRAIPDAHTDERSAAFEAPAATGPSPAGTFGPAGAHGLGPARGRSSGAAPLPDGPARSGMELAECLSENGRAVSAELLRYMAGRRKASFEDIAHEVCGDPEAKDSRIRQIVYRTNLALEGLGATTHFHTRRGYVIKEDHSR
jgi:hypothetical protein